MRRSNVELIRNLYDARARGEQRGAEADERSLRAPALWGGGYRLAGRCLGLVVRTPGEKLEGKETTVYRGRKDKVLEVWFRPENQERDEEFRAP